MRCRGEDETYLLKEIVELGGVGLEERLALGEEGILDGLEVQDHGGLRQRIRDAGLVERDGLVR